jgi:hypothetical protein
MSAFTVGLVHGLRRAGLAASAVGLTAALFAAPEAAAQSPLQLGAATAFERYTFSEVEGSNLESISLLSVPFEARARLGGGLSLDARGAWATGKVRWRDGQEMELTGPTDTEVRLTWELARRAIRLEVVGTLPTGESTHDTEQAVVAGIVAADLLPFRITNWGSAGAVAVSLSGAQRVGSVGLGASVSYRLSDEFDPIEGEDFAYQPGDEFRVRLGLDYAISRSQKLSLAFGYRNYEADVANDQNLFQTGDRMVGLMTWSFPVSRRSAGALYGGYLHRENGAFLSVAADEVPSQDLLLMGAMMRAPWAGGFISPRVDARLYTKGSGEAGNGYVVGAGLSLERPAGTSLTLVPSATARFGSVEATPGVDTSFLGFDIGLITRIGRRGR